MNKQSVIIFFKTAWNRFRDFMLSDPLTTKKLRDIKQFIWAMKRLIVSAIVVVIVTIVTSPLRLFPELKYLHFSLVYIALVFWFVYVTYIFIMFSFNTNHPNLVTRLVASKDESRIRAYQVGVLLTIFGFLADPLLVLVLAIFVIVFALAFEISLGASDIPPV